MEDDHHRKSIELSDAILHLKTKNEVDNFLIDLCTPNEIKTLKERWKVCQLLAIGDLSYREIHKITGASLTTIGRVARFLRDESYGGYRNLLKKTREQNV